MPRNSGKYGVIGVILFLTVMMLTFGVFYFYPENSEPYSPYMQPELLFVKEQVDRVNSHNQHELENGFVPSHLADKVGTLCQVPTDEQLVRWWWNNNTSFSQDFESRTYGDIITTVCTDHPIILADSNRTKNKGESGLIACLRTLSMVYANPSSQYDSLFLSAKFCNMAIVRPNPSLQITNSSASIWNNLDKRYNWHIGLNISLPNGTAISARSDLVQFLFRGKGCIFSIVSASEILLQYNHESGDSECYQQLVGSRDPCDEANAQDCYLYETVCTDPICGFAVAWNWSNPIVNSMHVSSWLVTHPIYQSLNRLSFIDLKLDYGQ